VALVMLPPIDVASPFRFPPLPGLDRHAREALAILDFRSRAFFPPADHTGPLWFDTLVPLLSLFIVPFPQWTHHSGVMSVYRKVKSPTYGYPIN
jgi:hypothetical protein